MQLIRTSSLMTLNISMNAFLLINPDTSMIEEDADGEDDDT